DNDQYKWSGMAVKTEHFIGYLDNNSLYALELDNESLLIPETSLKPFRTLLGIIPDTYFGICSRSIQLVEWNGKNKYCGTCGSETSLHLVEKAMFCKDCNNLIYPRISPCIIVLVTDNERLLLAHNKNFPTKIFSTLAGFIEVGETVEEAIQREIFEEVSIKVKNCQYYGSQSWPFPSQLMLGFHAEYEEGDLKPDGEEIDIAEWFHYQSLPDVPPGRISISGRLIESYVNKLTKKDLPGFT
ncbi:MAG TPA: NAD(+) diphosphatase, partial [Gammaproteobacteria bacterium]|nr:NAD(+) diphosphatase [Gammaproteobacteria bacterium]